MTVTTQSVPRPRIATEGEAIARMPAEERRAAGRSVRAAVPLDALAECPKPTSSRDALALLEQQSAPRVPELVPIRYGRMLATQFSYYRGAALPMAADLAGPPHTTLTVQMCGDAHVANFGFFGSPERRLVFDTNDFDETLPGPFEFDVKRLVASLEVAGRENGLSRKQRRRILRGTAARYRTAMAGFAEARDLDVWYSYIDTDDFVNDPRLDNRQRKALGRALDKARSRDSQQAFGKLTESVDGRTVIRSQPPLLVPIEELLPETTGRDLAEEFHQLIRQYRRTLQADRRLLLERYGFVDMARKVVGVGSVGTRCWVVLFTGRDDDDPLLLQVKEAEQSVHARFLGRSQFANQGERVVTGQRLMQQASDVFLGWQRATGIDGAQRDFYVRQLHDWKGSLDTGQMRPEGLQLYAEACAWCLARAHARTGDRLAIAGYLGSSNEFEHAIADFAEAYADLNEHDHQQLADAVAAGRITVEKDI